MKEATCVRCGSTKRVNSLSVADTNQLWEAVKNHDFDGYWRVNNKIMFGTQSGSEVRSVPIRVHVGGVATPMQFSLPAPDEEATLGVALQTMLPDLFPSGSALADEAPVLIQGIRPPLQTPLLWLADNLASIDNFLYFYVPSGSGGPRQ
mmetsp:Transcript_58241/g.137307  ORF Transcript_58241/g.137307 Transcript_58241/m.137307 type:complete len:149 (+) Transcript_58241:398-844(+)